MNDKIFADSFHQVRFSDIPDLHISKTKLPDGKFYGALYEEIARRGVAVPNEDKIIRNKNQTASIIAEIAFNHFKKEPSGLNVLSSGAGLGIVEGAMHELGMNVTAIEFKKDPTYWNSAVEHISDLSELPPNRKFDVVMEVSTFYTMNDQQLDSHIAELSERVRSGGLIIVYEQESLCVVDSIKSFLLSLLVVYIKRKKWDGLTLWGYLRTPQKLIAMGKCYANYIESRYFGLNDDWSIFVLKKPVTRIFGRQLFRGYSRSQMHIFEKI